VHAADFDRPPSAMTTGQELPAADVGRARELCDTDTAALYEFDGELVHLRSIVRYAAYVTPDASEAYQRLFPMVPTRGTLAMLAQWISVAARQHFEKARREPLITLGSAPPRYGTSIGEATTKGALRDIHRRGDEDVGAEGLIRSQLGSKNELPQRLA
jgi:hypothetical protein